MDRKSTAKALQVPKDTKDKASIRQDLQVLKNLTHRAIYYSTQMIHLANNRDDVQKGDPKVGGHPAACASSAHILGALHLLVKQPQDYLAVKPHASPMDHSYAHLLGLFYHLDGRSFTDVEAKAAMTRLRKFMDPKDPNHEPAFQSYHAAWDPDAYHFFPSGSVGIPPVVSAYTALAYRFAEAHGFNVPKNAHFWSVIGDSEFREGSLSECMPDIAERGLSNVTWIIDYNRQNLDGNRIVNEEGIKGTDAERIEKLGQASGWEVLQVRHGSKRLALFASAGGEAVRKTIEALSDFELQALLVKRDGKVVRDRFIELNPATKKPLEELDDEEVFQILTDLGGHDIEVLAGALEHSRNSSRPTLVVVHTIKGWGLECAAVTGNHSLLVSDEEIETLRKKESIPADDLFALFDEKTKEAQFCKKRGDELRQGIEAHRKLKAENLQKVRTQIEADGGFPTEFGINLKLSPWANTQWMWGQIVTKMIRIANDLQSGKDLPENEKRWASGMRFIATMAPDVGTSTNLNPNMDGKVFAPHTVEDFEQKYDVKDKRRPNLVPLEKEQNRHLRFEIEESNAMSCAGAFGKMYDHVGVPMLPMMTIYDFFIKRALDQFFYNAYWQSSFILVGTPSGVSLSPEGAQHSWKSDFQIPNSITWEPAFAVEMDWIIADATKRHFLGENTNRETVLIRAVTRGIEQKQLIENLKSQKRFEGASDDLILEEIRQDTLAGGYWLVNYEGYEGYHPGDNVVHLFVMGALVTEAVEASKKLQEKGVYANVCVVTSHDLLVGTLGRETGYQHLRQKLGVNGNLHFVGANRNLSSQAELLALRGSRIPIVAICDGEPGLLDNIGSVVGVPQETLAVRKHSKSGRPIDVYKYHHLDPDSILEAAMLLLEELAREELTIPSSII
ncbi:MAG: pyruvate dehydrogenase [Bacteriovoracia bacterium]